MADKTIQLSIKVNSETGQLEVLGAKLKVVADSAKGTRGAFAGLSGEAGGLLKSLLPFATAGGILAFFTDSVKAAEEENQALNRLKFTVTSMGGSWDKAKEQVMSWGTAIAATTRFSDGEAFTALDRLARITGNVTTAQKASQVAMGLSVASGKSLNETTELMANLLAGNERALIETKREFGAFAGEARTAQQALDLLNNKFGDAAFKEDSFTKQTDQLKNAFGEFKEQVGRGLIPALLPVFDILSMIMRGFRELGIVLAGLAASFVVFAEGVGAAVLKMAKLDFSGAKEKAKTLGRELVTIEQETAASIDEIEAESAKKDLVRDSQSVQLKALRSKQEVATAEEDAKKLAQIEAELDQKMAGLGQDSFAKKRAMLNAEIAAERTKINTELKLETDKAKALDKLKILEAKSSADLAKQEVKFKTAGALEIVDLSLQTLSLLNGMGESHNKGEVRRAKAILALQQAIAIARVWAAEASKGVVGIGIAAASTALIVAQFAVQSKAIDKAAEQANAGNESFSISTPLPGSDSTLNQSFGTNTAPPGSPSRSGGGFSGAPSAGGAGGGTTVINVGGVIVNFQADHFDLSEADALLQKLAEAVRRGTTEGINFAVSVSNVGTKNAGRAV